jgi:hypothetical protein
MPRGQYDRSKMKKPVETLDTVRFGFVPPGLKKERNDFVMKELTKNPRIAYDKMRAMLKEKGMAGIGSKLFCKMKKESIKRVLEPVPAKVEVRRVVMDNECEKRTLDIDLTNSVQYTAIRFMKGKVVMAELPMVTA